MDTEKIKKLLAENNVTELENIFKDIVREEMTEEERGKALVNFATAYIELTNEINEAQKAVLEDILAGLKILDEAKSSVEDQFKAEEIRRKLKE